jgi:pyruvate formate lyase activating enzyme
MKVNYGSYVPLSTVDDLGHSSVVIFLRGCELRCWYCHNKHLLSGEELVDIEEIKDSIKQSAPYVSSVTISGGEPLLQIDAVEELIDYAHSLNLEVCLYTSGNNPNELRRIAYKIDRCYIDIKMENAKIENHAVYMRNVFRSITILDEASADCLDGVETTISLTIFDVEQSTLDEIEDYKMFIGDLPLIINQGQINTVSKVRHNKMVEVFKGYVIKTRENGVEYNADYTD